MARVKILQLTATLVAYSATYCNVIIIIVGRAQRRALDLFVVWHRYCNIFNG